MQLAKLFLVAVLLLSSLSAEAKKGAAETCRAIKWPFSREQTSVANYQVFHSIPRPVVEAYFLSELTADGLPKSNVSYDLGRFLIDSESNKDKKAYYELITWGADLFGKGNKPTKLKLDGLCKLRKKAFGA